MHERFLERIAVSEYRNNIILKGGMLIASIVGLNIRSTVDMDANINGYSVTAETIEKMIQNIIDIDLNDNDPENKLGQSQNIFLK